MGLDLIFLLIVDHASDTSQAMAVDESISDQAPQMGKLDLAMDDVCRDTLSTRSRRGEVSGLDEHFVRSRLRSSSFYTAKQSTVLDLAGLDRDASGSCDH
jgi:hypothetical protein